MFKHEPQPATYWHRIGSKQVETLLHCRVCRCWLDEREDGSYVHKTANLVALGVDTPNNG